MTDHTPECLTMARSQMAAFEAYFVEWPHACKVCAGAGGETVYDIVDYGSTTTQMPSWCECPNCLEQGKCPRCGGMSPQSLDEHGICDGCGWECDVSPSAPSLHECWGECRLEAEG